MTVNSIWAKAWDRFRLSLSQLSVRRMVPMRNSRPLISFSFDDFPRTALQVGGGILQRHNLRGTFYAALGLMDRANSPVGPIFSQADFQPLLSAGHELGCHTFGHDHAWNTPSQDFDRSLVQNRESLQRLLPTAEFKTMSYPIDVPRPQNKRRASKYFAGCRGGGQTFNVGTMDLNNLRAFFIEKSTPALIEQVIEQNTQACGWLVFATHDVCDQPSRFGCTPRLFEEVVRQAMKSGSRILPVSEALHASVSVEK